MWVGRVQCAHVCVCGVGETLFSGGGGGAFLFCLFLFCFVLFLFFPLFYFCFYLCVYVCIYNYIYIFFFWGGGMGRKLCYQEVSYGLVTPGNYMSRGLLLQMFLHLLNFRPEFSKSPG